MPLVWLPWEVPIWVVACWCRSGQIHPDLALVWRQEARGDGLGPSWALHGVICSSAAVAMMVNQSARGDNRRTDELVDGPNASHITPQALDRWERRLEDLFVGRPYDLLDAALSDTITKFPIDIQ
ncbi:hypothetical protein ZWY2020_014379 [Hordeum vulgare]|nr:hypothetical protein ZWY2020_014379 [Hordeum vulgare]